MVLLLPIIKGAMRIQYIFKCWLDSYQMYDKCQKQEVHSRITVKELNDLCLEIISI